MFTRKYSIAGSTSVRNRMPWRSTPGDSVSAPPCNCSAASKLLKVAKRVEA